MTDKQKIAELAECVFDALSMPPKRWSGIMGKGGIFKHWTQHFCDSLERCGFNVDRDAVSKHHFGVSEKEADKCNPMAGMNK